LLLLFFFWRDTKEFQQQPWPPTPQHQQGFDTPEQQLFQQHFPPRQRHSPPPYASSMVLLNYVPHHALAEDVVRFFWQDVKSLYQRFDDKGRKLGQWVVEFADPSIAMEALMSNARIMGLSAPKAVQIRKDQQQLYPNYVDEKRVVVMNVPNGTEVESLVYYFREYQVESVELVKTENARGQITSKYLVSVASRDAADRLTFECWAKMYGKRPVYPYVMY